MAFINHCGASKLTLEPSLDEQGYELPSLRALPDPVKLTSPRWQDEFHGDHTPIRHDLVVDLSKQAINRCGYDITSEEYSLLQTSAFDNETGRHIHLPNGEIKPEKDNMFGYLEVRRRNTEGMRDITHVVGIRNSNTMDSKASLGCGERVFVCDNMAFSAEFLIFRKHTKNIKAELPERMNDCVEELAAEFMRAEARVEIYKQANLRDEDVHDIMMRSIQQDYRYHWQNNRLVPTLNDGNRVFEPVKHTTPPSKLGQWMKEYKAPSHDEFAGTNAWCLKNAYTEVIKDWKVDALQQRTQKLTTVMDRHPAIDFENKYQEWRAN